METIGAIRMTAGPFQNFPGWIAKIYHLGRSWSRVSAHDRRQRRGDLLAAAVAAKGFDQLAAGIDQIKVGTVIVGVIAVIRIVALIENIEAFCSRGNLRRTSGEADKM